MLASTITVPNSVHLHCHFNNVQSTTKKIYHAPPPRKHVLYLPLRSVVPTTFSDMYTSDLLSDPKSLNALGRPLFTERQLVDWALNDLRSLLIVEKLQLEWDSALPKIIERGYRMIYLPLAATNEQIVDCLVSSDIYKEHDFDTKFLIQTAQYTVEAARQRQTSLDCLTKPEWRNIIENYLLNLACEAQCRLDFKKSCALLKQKKLQHELQLETTTTAIKRININSSSSLLKKAILTSCSTSPDFPSYLRSKPKVSLSKTEKQSIWIQVQSNLYKRLGLDWEADKL